MAGRYPIFNEDETSVEEVQRRIDAYFEECNGKPLTDSEGNVLTDKYGMPIMVDVQPYTITGLALAIGFTNRQSLLNYQAKPIFFDTITRAKAKVEQYAEKRLFDKDGANGAKFSLANNFSGWKEQRSIEADVNSEINISVELVDDVE